MRVFIVSAAITALLFDTVCAFPALLGNPNAWEARNEKRQAVAPPQGAGALPLTPPPFDAKSQLVSTSGQYAWVAPSSGDARGECPGLNALANHGYLPHNGVATIQQFVTATNTGVGMAMDLGGFLAVYGAIVDGDGSSWSIAGVPHTGIAGSHHNYEADSSPFKADLNQYGSNSRLILSQFRELYNMQPNAATANYNLEVFRAFRGSRFQQSISQNPYFFYGPFDGVEVSQAAYTFIYRFMSNKSAEYPEGILNKNVLKSWMSISGPDDNLVWIPGHERIPDNWYKRNAADQYSIPYFQTDIAYFAQTVPQILSIGCNQGQVNTYNTFSITSLTNGAATAQSVLANPFCFSAQFGIASAQALGGLSASQEQQLKNAAAPYLKAAGCKDMTFNTTSLTQLKNCPGFSFYGGPTGPVAPGAIQPGGA